MIVFRLIAFVIRLVLSPIIAVWVVLRRRIPRKTWLQIEIDGPVVEFPTAPRALALLSFARQRPVAISTLHDLADEIAKEPRVKGVVFVIRGLGGGLATATSLRKVIARVREMKREVVVHLPNGGDTREIYVASAANRVIAAPHATLAPVGFVSSSRYAKRALDKIGVQADRLHAGAYKSAGETLALEHMSEPQREQLGALLDTFYEELTAAIAEGRKVDLDRAKALIDGAPYHADRARDAGLIDAVAYEDELGGLLGENGERAHTMSAMRFLSARRARVLPRLRRPAALAVLPLHGAIMSGGGPLAMDERFVSAVRSARSNRRVRGVLLHIDSPGGGALASDRIHHELVLLAREKPVVAYFGNVAASGGYYAAAAAHHIVCEPTTITGSIGVVAARIVVEPLFERLGVFTETLKRGAHATLLDPFHRVDENERAVLEGELQNFYEGFLDVVARGRKRSRDDVHAVAQGRVWSGRDAKEKGLVDELGDGRDAVNVLRKRVGPAGESMQLVTIRRSMQRHPPMPSAGSQGALTQTRALQGEAAWSQLITLLGFDSNALSLFFSRERVLAFLNLPSLF